MVIERYDRSPEAPQGRTQQEDTNQVLGAAGNQKYQKYGGKVSFACTARVFAAAGDRQLVDDACLPGALALRQSGSQLTSMICGPAGGALVAFAGFAAASAADSVSFAAVLVALIAISPRRALPDAPRRSVLREAADGIRVAVRTPGLAALLLVAGVAGFVIPATSLAGPWPGRGS